MKNFMFFLLSLITLAAVITIEGGNIAAYMQISAGLLITFGVLFSTLFSFSLKEIKETFRDAFSENIDSSKINNYKKGYLVATSMSRLCIYWAIIGFILGIIYVLSHTTSPEKLGLGLAMTLVSALYGIVYAGTLFVPMSHTLSKKLQDIEIK